MKYIVNSMEMKACDRYTTGHYHVPSLLLMEHAAQVFVDELLKCSCDMKHTGIVCGYGNNGGDGLAIARLLHLAGYHAQVWMVGDESRATEQTKIQIEMVRSYGIPIHEICEEPDFSECTVIVDAMFGVGLSREITGIYARVIKQINESRGFVAAVDIPSGICADNGHILGCAVNAQITITFAFHKAGLILYPGAACSGKIIVRDIGIGSGGMNGHSSLFTYDDDEISSILPERLPYSNKGTYGKVVLVAGSRGMAGAAYLAGMAAYRMGCGLVRIITPSANREILQQLLPEAVLTLYDENNPDIGMIRPLLEGADCIGIGSGLGCSHAADILLGEVLGIPDIPVVVDGDALRLLSAHLDILQESDHNIIMTPHLKEMSVLTHKTVPEIQKNIVQEAEAFAQFYHVCCVLKDARTVVSCETLPTYINLTGNHGMATAGSGDVLAGMLCGILAGGADSFRAAAAAVYLHGRAGDLAAEAVGARGMTARDLVSHISRALQDMEA